MCQTAHVYVRNGSASVAQRGDSITSVARKQLKRTKYLTSTELTGAIREANHNRQGVFLKSGEQIIIPGILEGPIVEKTVPVARDFEVRAIYLTGVMAGSDHGMRIIRHWREVGGNAVVFDIKDSDGIVNIAFDHPLATGQRHYISDLPKLIRFLHSEVGTDVVVDVESSASSDSGTTPVHFSGSGRLRNNPFTVEGDAASLLALEKGDRPYRVNATARAGYTSVRFEGTVIPNNVDNVEASLTLQGRDLSQLATVHFLRTYLFFMVL